MQYRPTGVCSTLISIDVEDNIIKSVEFTGGCNGNTQGISVLVEGMNVDDAIKKLSGIKCGFRNTSCPDQLAIALTKLNNQEA